MVLNLVVLSIAALLAFALCGGLVPLLVKLVCRTIYYATGSSQVVGEICESGR